MSAVEQYIQTISTIQDLEKQVGELEKAVNRKTLDMQKPRPKTVLGKSTQDVIREDIQQKENQLMLERGLEYLLVCPVCRSRKFTKTEPTKDDMVCECQQTQHGKTFYQCSAQHAFWDLFSMKTPDQLCQKCVWIKSTETKEEREAAKTARLEANGDKFTPSQLRDIEAEKQTIEREARITEQTEAILRAEKIKRGKKNVR